MGIQSLLPETTTRAWCLGRSQHRVPFSDTCMNEALHSRTEAFIAPTDTESKTPSAGNMSYPGAAPPPPGATADLDNPQDVLRTVNYVTQALTLLLTTAFVLTRLYAKSRILGGGITIDDCKCRAASVTVAINTLTLLALRTDATYIAYVSAKKRPPVQPRQLTHVARC